MYKVMVVEDFDILRDDIRETVEASGKYEVVADFGRGDEAVKYALENEPDLILMDISLETPRAGIDAAAHIHSKKPRIKIIFMTAYEDKAIIIDAMDSGGADYIVKDCEPDELIERMDNVIKNRVSLDHRVNRTLLDEYERLKISERSLLFFINNVGHLTPSEFEIVKYLIEGKTNREIAEKRCVEQVTVKTQLRTLLNKFGCTRKKEMLDMIRNLKLEYLFREEKEE